MAPPTLAIFAPYASLILLTSHRPKILGFHELNKIKLKFYSNIVWFCWCLL